MANEYFSDEEKEESEEEQIQPAEPDVATLNDILEVRKKFKMELDIRIPDINKRLNLITFELFGNPNKDQEIPGLIYDLNMEATDPILGRHPIADISKKMITQVKRLQIEYHHAHRMYKQFLTDYDRLILTVVKVAQRDIIDYKNKGQIKPPEEVDRWLSKNEIETFLKISGQKAIDRYNMAVKEKNYMKCFHAKRDMKNMLEGYFPRHPNSNRLSVEILDKYGDVRWVEVADFQYAKTAQKDKSKEQFEGKNEVEKVNENFNSSADTPKKSSTSDQPHYDPLSDRTPLEDRTDEMDGTEENDRTAQNDRTSKTDRTSEKGGTYQKVPIENNSEEEND